MANREREFRRRGPWITQFTIDGQTLGGAYDPADDRFARFAQSFPTVGRVLELGCLEGGHSLLLAQRATEVVAIDARPDNLAKARWVQSLLGLTNIQFLQADLETEDLRRHGKFDLIFNCGLLYHLHRPFPLLERLVAVGSTMFLWTHVARPDQADCEQNGYRGIFYREHGWRDPLSGLAPTSFWPTLPELQRMLGDVGFINQEVVAVDEQHPHGHAVTLIVRKESVNADDVASDRQIDRLVGVQ